MYKIGIDLGGTKIEGIVLDANLKEVFRRRIPTEQEKGYDGILQNIRKLYKVLVDEIGSASHTFGIGTPGAISPRTGLLRNSNTLCLNGQPLQQDLEKLFDRPVAMQNDANCFAMAEALLGAGVDKNLVFGVIMGTGCGGGIVYKGEVLTGPQAIAGEWGHTSMDPNGPACWCGSVGCVETLISGAGLQKLYRKRFDENLKFDEIMQRYREKDPRANEFIQDFFKNFGRAMGNVINILDPDIVVLGGGLSNVRELYNEGVEHIEKWVFNDYFSTPIMQNKLGDSAGVIGAALIGI